MKEKLNTIELQSVETSMLNLLDMKIININKYAKKLQKLGIYIKLETDKHGEIFLKNLNINRDGQ